MRDAERRSAADLIPQSASTLGDASQVEPPDESRLVAGCVVRRMGGDPGVPRPTATRAALSARVDAMRNACDRPRLVWADLKVGLYVHHSVKKR